jgi:peptide/nickel transport system permease protein
MSSLRAYIIGRVLLTIPMLWVLVTIVFLILRVMPGDPCLAILREAATKQQLESCRHGLGIDRPLILQYADYLGGVVRGDLGVSMTRRRPVTQEIADRFPATIELSIFAMLVTVVVGISTGAYAAQKRKSLRDYGLRIFSIVIYSMPIFWFGLILQLIFGLKLGLLPTYGRVGTELAPQAVTGLYVVDSILTLNWPALSSTLQHLVLPSLTLGLVLSGVFTRLTRANMLDVLRQDFITSGRARGIPERSLVYGHALKNAFIPVLTLMGLQFAILLAGAILTESTFSWPGMGRLLVERIYDRDFATVQGVVTLFAGLVALISLLVDVAYAYIDPRIRY